MHTVFLGISRLSGASCSSQMMLADAVQTRTRMRCRGAVKIQTRRETIYKTTGVAVAIAYVRTLKKICYLWLKPVRTGGLWRENCRE